MTKEVSVKKQKDIDALYNDVHKWVSEIHFVQDEIIFVKKLLNSDAFEPNTPNLFERIREYVGSLESFEIELIAFKTKLLGHEKDLGTYLECVGQDHSGINKKHWETVGQLEVLLGKFQMLKSEIFEYVRGIFRRKSS